ncbi:MAG: hypothetical protein ACSHXB_16285 [Sulfitobacter sp.]
MGNSGVILLSTMISTMILLAVVIAVQARMQAQARTMATLIKAENNALHQRAVGELLRGDIALAILRPEAPSAPPLNGEIYEYVFDGKTARVQLQDVGGLVDIYQSGPDQLALVGFDSSEIETILNWRETPLGLARLAGLEQTMAVLDLGRKPQAFLTQRRQSSRINPETAPTVIQDQVEQLSQQSLRILQAQLVRVKIELTN